jgi:hypothetical protein
MGSIRAMMKTNGPQLSEKRSMEVIGYLLFVIDREIYSIFIVLPAVKYAFLLLYLENQ